MNNKGFTLVELLVAVSILAIITVIAIPTLRAFQTGNSKKQYESFADSMISSAKLYNDSYSDDLFGNALYGCEKVKLSEMINKKVAKDIALKDITCNKSENDSYVVIKKFKNEYAYSGFVHCENSKGVLQFSTDDILSEECETTTGEPELTVTSYDEVGKTSKKKSAYIHISDDYGLVANQKVSYAWSTINNDNGAGVTGFKEYDYNNAVLKTTGSKVKISSSAITIPNSATGTYYLYVRPIRVQNILNNTITGIRKYGPFRFDHTPPACPSFSAVNASGGTLNSETPSKVVKINYSFPDTDNDLQNYDLQVSYNGGSDWSQIETRDKSNTQFTATQDGKVKIRIKGRDYANNISNTWCESSIYYRDTTPPTNPTVKGYKRTSSTAATSKGSLSEVNSNTLISGWSFVVPSGSTDTFGTISYYYTTTGAHGTVASTKASYLNVDNEGTTTVRYKACDSAGNCSGEVSYVVKLDRTPPNCPTVVAKAGSSTLATNTWTTAANVAFTFTFSSDTTKWDWYTNSSTNDKTVDGVKYKLWSSGNSSSNNTASISGQGKRMILTRVYDSVNNGRDCTFGTYNIEHCESTTVGYGSYGSCVGICGTGTKTRPSYNYSTLSGHTTYVCSNGPNDSASCTLSKSCEEWPYSNDSGGVYKTLQDAINDTPNNGTIKLNLSTYNDTKGATLNANKTISYSSSGKTVNLKNAKIIVKNGTFNIKAGNINTSEHKRSAISVSGGTVNISGGYIHNLYETAVEEGTEAIELDGSSAKVTMSGGKIESGTGSGSGYARVVNITSSGGTFKMSGGTAISNATGQPWGGTGINVYGGSATMTGGTLKDVKGGANRCLLCANGGVIKVKDNANLYFGGTVSHGGYIYWSQGSGSKVCVEKSVTTNFTNGSINSVNGGNSTLQINVNSC